MATFTVRGDVQITASKYQNQQEYPREGFRLQVFDEDLLSNRLGGYRRAS